MSVTYILDNDLEIGEWHSICTCEECQKRGLPDIGVRLIKSGEDKIVKHRDIITGSVHLHEVIKTRNRIAFARNSINYELEKLLRLALEQKEENK